MKNIYNAIQKRSFFRTKFITSLFLLILNIIYLPSYGTTDSVREVKLQIDQETFLTESRSIKNLIENETQFVDFKAINVNPLDSRLTVFGNFNPLDLDRLMVEGRNIVYHDPMSGKKVDVNRIYFARRSLNTNLDVSVFNKIDLSKQEIQSKLFSEINFKCNDELFCKTQQSFFSGVSATYNTIYQYYSNQSELNSIKIPDALMDNKTKSKVIAAFVQYGVNWDNLMASALNIVYFVEGQNDKLQLVTYQILLFSLNGIQSVFAPDRLLLDAMRTQIETQSKSLYKFLKEQSSN